MSRGVHHITVITSDADSLIGFLSVVLGLPVVTSQTVERGNLGPLFEGAGVECATSTMLGDARHGLVEIVDIVGEPRAGRGADEALRAGVHAISFAVRDVATTVHAAVQEYRGHLIGQSQVCFGGVDVVVGVVRVGGATIQLTQFA